MGAGHCRGFRREPAARSLRGPEAPVASLPLFVCFCTSAAESRSQRTVVLGLFKKAHLLMDGMLSFFPFPTPTFVLSRGRRFNVFVCIYFICLYSCRTWVSVLWTHVLRLHKWHIRNLTLLLTRSVRHVNRRPYCSAPLPHFTHLFPQWPPPPPHHHRRCGEHPQTRPLIG